MILSSRTCTSSVLFQWVNCLFNPLSLPAPRAPPWCHLLCFLIIWSSALCDPRCSGALPLADQSWASCSLLLAQTNLRYPEGGPRNGSCDIPCGMALAAPSKDDPSSNHLSFQALGFSTWLDTISPVVLLKVNSSGFQSLKFPEILFSKGNFKMPQTKPICIAGNNLAYIKSLV